MDRTTISVAIAATGTIRDNGEDCVGVDEGVKLVWTGV
jgi:hypothetical protein